MAAALVYRLRPWPVLQQLSVAGTVISGRSPRMPIIRALRLIPLSTTVERNKWFRVGFWHCDSGFTAQITMVSIRIGTAVVHILQWRCHSNDCLEAPDRNGCTDAPWADPTSQSMYSNRTNFTVNCVLYAHRVVDVHGKGSLRARSPAHDQSRCREQCRILFHLYCVSY